LEQRRFKFQELSEAADTSVGDEDVESAELGNRLGYKVLACGRLADIARDKQKWNFGLFLDRS
jgi:hypothetical protein